MQTQNNDQKPERVIRIQMSTLVFIAAIVGLIAGHIIYTTLGGVQ